MIGQVEKRKVNEPVRIAAVAAAVGFLVQAAFRWRWRWEPRLGVPRGVETTRGNSLWVLGSLAALRYSSMCALRADGGEAGRVSHLATALWRPEMGNMGARRPEVFGSAPTIRVLERLGALWLGTLFTDTGRAVPLCGA